MTTKTQQRSEIVKADLDASIAELEEIAREHSVAVLAPLGRFKQGVVLAQGIVALRKALLPMLQHLVPLQGCALGFLTDRDRGGERYPAELVCECLIEATLRGLYPVNNEFNIISGRCYTTKNGYKRLVRELPGLTDLRLHREPPRLMGDKGACVKCRAEWRLNGEKQSLEADIPVKLNAGMGADAALGKAERKLLARVYEQITGSDQSGLDAEVTDPLETVDRPAAADAVKAKLEARASEHAVNKETERKLFDLSRQAGLTEKEFADLGEACGVPAGAERPTQVQAEAMIARLEETLASQSAE